jgi:hypothetical protein
MPAWVRKVFIQIMPKFLMIKRPEIVSKAKPKPEEDMRYLNCGYNEFDYT